VIHNEPDDKFIYQITISIGRVSSKEFNTKLFCVLYGENGKTTPIELEDGKRKVSLIMLKKQQIYGIFNNV